MPRRAPPIILISDERSKLDRLIRAASTPQQTVLRARMIVLMAEGKGVGETAQVLGVWRKGVSRQRARWLAAPSATVVERLSDAPRSGAPSTFSPEQTCAIVALACEPPTASGIPISHWSASDLAREAVQRGIVPRISPRTVGRFFKNKPISSRISCGPG